MQSSAVLLALSLALLESVGAVAFDPSLALGVPMDSRALLGARLCVVPSGGPRFRPAPRWVLHMG